MALQVVSPAVSVYKTVAVVNGAEEVEEHTIPRGELLPDWVSSHQQFVLTQTGMVRQVGDFPDPTLIAAERMPAPVVMPEHSPLAVFGTPVTAPMVVTKTVTGTGQADAGDGGTVGDGSLPADGDTKPEWEKAAVRLGVPRAEAESMRKADLVKEVKARHAEQAADQDPPLDKDFDNAALPPTFAKGGPAPKASDATPAKGGPAAPKAG